MADIMLALGPYRFQLNTAAYQSLQRSTLYRWPQQERLGREPASQYVGPGTDTMTLEGVIYTAFRGGLGQPEAMRELAASGSPHLLVDGQGVVHGKWTLTQVDETQSTFLAGGVPRKQTFTLTLQKYGKET